MNPISYPSLPNLSPLSPLFPLHLLNFGAQWCSVGASRLRHWCACGSYHACSTLPVSHARRVSPLLFPPLLPFIFPWPLPPPPLRPLSSSSIVHLLHCLPHLILLLPVSPSSPFLLLREVCSLSSLFL